MKKKLLIIVSIVLVFAVFFAFFIISPNKNKNELKSYNFDNNKIILNDTGTPRYVEGTYISSTIKENDNVFLALNELKDLYGFENAKDNFNILRVDEVGDYKYYKVQQKYKSILVYGKQLVLTVGKNNKITSVTGTYYGVNDTYGYIDLEKIKNDFITKNPDANIISSDRYYYIKDKKAYLSVIIDAITPNGYYSFVFDKDNNLIDKISKMYNNMEQITTKDALGNNINIDLSYVESLGSKMYKFRDEKRNIIIVDAYNMGKDIGNPNNIKWINLLTSILKETDKFPIVAKKNNEKLLYVDYNSFEVIEDYNNRIIDASSAIYNFQKTYDYYKNILGRNGYDNNNPETYVYIGAKKDFMGSEYWNNACWSDGYFVFGAYNNITFSAAFDVVAHEYTHAVTQYTSGLVYEGESGALNESYSDILGSLIENKDFTIGESIETMRDMTNPETYKDPGTKNGKYFFPTDTEYYNEEWKKEMLAAYEKDGRPLDSWLDYDYGGVHVNSGVANHAAYLMYKNGAFKSKEEMAKVWYNSMFLLSSTADFEDCAIAVIEAADNLGLSKEKIDIIIDAFIETKMLDYDEIEFSGTVTDKETKKPIEGALVSLSCSLNPHVKYETYTDKKGNYKFDNIPTMKYEVEYTKSKYNNKFVRIELKKDDNKRNVSLEKIDEIDYKEAEVVFVLDISASMDTSDPSDIRKQIMANILYSLDTNYSFSLVTFTGYAKVVNGKMSNKPNDKKILMTDIFNIANDSGNNDYSGTNGKEAIAKALDLFSNSSKRKYIVFLTDGVDNKTTSLTYENLTKEANDKKVRILSIGLGEGEEFNETQLKLLADNTKGKYYNATESNILYKFNKTILEELE